jgi:hypothetical protein
LNPKYLGDSYDIVKQSLLSWLGKMGPWATHPMFTGDVCTEQADTFALLIGTRLLSCEMLTRGTDRNTYLAPARDCHDHVFLDPDTGIRLKPTQGAKAPHYLFGTELAAITEAHPERLVLVFDQSLARGKEREQLQMKLGKLVNLGMLGIAYISHACFVLLGKNRTLLDAAFDTLKKRSRLPEDRFLSWDTQNQAVHRIAEKTGSR